LAFHWWSDIFKVFFLLPRPFLDQKIQQIHRISLHFAVPRPNLHRIQNYHQLHVYPKLLKVSIKLFQSIYFLPFFLKVLIFYVLFLLLFIYIELPNVSSYYQFYLHHILLMFFLIKGVILRPIEFYSISKFPYLFFSFLSYSNYAF
jgi:hypothetical protein